MIKRLEMLSILTGGTCNLQCSYCFLHKERKAKELDDEITLKLKNGEYALNCFKSINSIGADTLKIKELELWGGEPTLHIKEFTDNINYWVQYFPNLEAISISSNGLYNIDYMYNHLLTVFKVWPNFKNYTLQISIDGPDELSIITRGITFSKVEENLRKLLDKISQNKLPNNFNLNICFKQTLPIEKMNQIHKTLDSTFNYYYFWHEKLYNLEKDYRYSYLNFFSGPITVTLLYDYTQQDGLDYAHTHRMYYAIDWKYLQNKFDTKAKVQDMMSPMKTYNEFGNHNSFDRSYYCGQYRDNIYIRPDGSIIGCLAGLYNDDKEFIERMRNENIEEYQASKNINSNFYLQPIGKTLEENIKFLERMWYLDNPETKVLSSAALIYELAKSNQVEPIYLKDNTLRIKHAYLIQNRSGCFFNSLRFSGDPYISSLGLYRLYCNGVLSYYDKIYHPNEGVYDI